MPSPYVQERSVLRPRADGDTDSDAWPEFELTNVRVHLPGDAGATVNLLHATEHYPVTLIGDLNPLPASLKHHYLQPAGQTSRRTTTIEIPEVRSYAYGQYSDGSVAIWAAGSAGWFTVRPGRAYRPIYNEMVEAVKVFYFIADAYRAPRKRGRAPKPAVQSECTAQEVMERYARDVLGAGHSTTDAAAKIHSHRQFLFSSMIAGKEGMAWSQNPMYQHLFRKYPKDHAMVKQRLAGPTKGSTSSLAIPRSGSIDSESTSSSRKRKRGSSLKSTNVTSLSPGSNASSVMKTTPTAFDGQAGDDDDDDDDESESEDEESHTKARKGRSALRPRSSAASKGIKRTGKGPRHDHLDDNDTGDDDERAAAPSPTNGRGHPKTLPQTRLAPRRNSRPPDGNEGLALPPSPSTSDHPDVAPPDPTFAHTPDPLQEETWVCALDGCSHKVYGAAGPAESQRLIRAHYALHAYDDDDRVRLVEACRAPSLPVAHLMERVRLQAKIEGFPGSKVAGTRFPVRGVVQRY